MAIPLGHERTVTAADGLGHVSSEERRARLVLTTLDLPGHPALGVLISRHGPSSALEQLRAGAYAPLRASIDVDRVRAAEDACDGQLENARRLGARYVCPGDPEWPDALDDLREADPRNGVGGTAVGLWLRGPLPLIAAVPEPRSPATSAAGASVAMVGSRAASDYGLYVASEIAAGLADADVRVVSGAAYGIDAAAHRGALAVPGGATVAVLACGVDVTYPKANEGLLARIGADGLIVSERPLGATPTRRHFLIRNRIVAALAHATVIVEATTRSGTTSTAEWAVACSRSVLAVPGPVTSALSAGTHSWIRDLDAGLVTNAADVLRQVMPIGSVAEPLRSPSIGHADRRARLSGDAVAVLDAMPFRAEAGVTQLVAASGLPIATVLARLGELDLGGFVHRAGSGWRMTDHERAAIRAEAAGRRDR